MKVVIFIIIYVEVILCIALLNCITFLFYTYLEEWRIGFLDYKEELEKKNSKELKGIDTLYQIYSKFVSTYEWIFRHLDLLNIFTIRDEE